MNLKLIAPTLLCAGFLAPQLVAFESSELPVPVSPAPTIEVFNEPIRLSTEKANKWAGGTRLNLARSRGVGIGLPTPEVLDPSSVRVYDDGKVFKPGEDYTVNGIYSTLSALEGGSIDSGETVLVDYVVSLRRIDSVIEDASGKRFLREGIPDFTVPQPPALEPGEVRVGNYFLDYFEPPEMADYYPILSPMEDAVTATSLGQGLKPILKQLAAGGEVRIVLWGDSITFGGDASSPDLAYPAVFERRLRELYPEAEIDIEVVAVGGSGSRHWLDPERYPHPTQPEACDFERVIAGEPDVVTVEFLNDAYMNRAQVDRTYGEIVSRLRAAGAQPVIVTPNFTMPAMMRETDLRAGETRPYVHALVEFAKENDLPLADVSGRWAHLWQAGLPYVTLLKNSINHPDDRGHELYADELIQLFKTP